MSDAIVGYAKCGCLVAAAMVRAEPERIYELARDMKVWEASGLRLDGATVEHVRANLGCTHKTTLGKGEVNGE